VIELTDTTEEVVSDGGSNATLEDGDEERNVDLEGIEGVRNVARHEETVETSKREAGSKNGTRDTNTNVEIGGGRELPDSEIRRDGANDTSGRDGLL